MSDRTLLLGKFLGLEHVSGDSKKAQAFHGEVLRWKVVSVSDGGGHVPHDPSGRHVGRDDPGLFDAQERPPSVALVLARSVEDVDAVGKSAAAKAER